MPGRRTRLRRTFTTSLLAIRIFNPLSSLPLSVCRLLPAYKDACVSGKAKANWSVQHALHSWVLSYNLLLS